MEEKNERKEKSEILFKKAMDCYTKQEYEDALKYFQASIKYYPNDRADLFIKVCQNNIPQNNTKNKTNTNSNSNSNYQKSYSSSFSNNRSNNYNFNKSNNNNYSHQESSSSFFSTNNND